MITRTYHGKRKTPEYRVWAGMKSRCYNKDARSYERYGKRNISVCSRWRNSFLNFYNDMGVRPTPTHTLERKDNNKSYSPSNCRWATRIEQANNRKTSVIIVWQNHADTLANWSRLMGIPYATLKKRLRNYGWSIERALTISPEVYKQR